MAFAQQRSGWYRVVFNYGGKKYRKGLKTTNAAVADAVVGGIKRTILMLEQGFLQIPEGADVLTFILSGGQTIQSLLMPPAPEEPTPEPVTLEQLRDKYVETMSIGAIEKTTLDTIKMHIRHIIKTLGEHFHLESLALHHLQGHVNRRAKDKGLHGGTLSSYTLRKEIASLRAVWNWGMHSGLVTKSFPNKGMKYPKLDEKPPYQTWAEIERRIALGGLVMATSRNSGTRSTCKSLRSTNC